MQNQITVVLSGVGAKSEGSSSSPGELIIVITVKKFSQVSPPTSCSPRTPPSPNSKISPNSPPSKISLTRSLPSPPSPPLPSALRASLPSAKESPQSQRTSPQQLNKFPSPSAKASPQPKTSPPTKASPPSKAPLARSPTSKSPPTRSPPTRPSTRFLTSSTRLIHDPQCSGLCDLQNPLPRSPPPALQLLHLQVGSSQPGKDPPSQGTKMTQMCKHRDGDDTKSTFTG